MAFSSSHQPALDSCLFTVEAEQVSSTGPPHLFRARAAALLVPFPLKKSTAAHLASDSHTPAFLDRLSVANPNLNIPKAASRILQTWVLFQNSSFARVL